MSKGENPLSDIRALAAKERLIMMTFLAPLQHAIACAHL
jgi:hypothetical protein